MSTHNVRDTDEAIPAPLSAWRRQPGLTKLLLSFWYIFYLVDGQRLFKAEATLGFYGLQFLLESFLDRFQLLTQLWNALGLQKFRLQHSGQSNKIEM